MRELGIPFLALDGLYEKSRSFTTLAKNIAKEVTRLAEGKNLCYVVDGAVTEDAAAQILLKKRGVRVIEGVGKAATAAAAAGLYGAFTGVSAYETDGRELTLPLVVYDLDDKLLASDVKLILMERFGDEAPAYLIHKGEGKKIALYEADREEEYDESTALVVYDIPLLQKERFDFADLITVLKRLRAPDGCPWDRVQTHESIRINMIEEAYELVDAIDSGDPDKIREEAGDVLMQAAFHALIEEEKGNFTVTDVLTELLQKLITRHTHVFGTDSAKDDAGALSVWEKNKMKEKHQVTYADAVNDVPACFPALLRAQKICKRMAKGGFSPSFEETAEEIRAWLRSLAEAREREDRAEIRLSLGNLLFALAQTARIVGVDSEQLLLDRVKEAQAVYTVWEGLVTAEGKDVNALTEAERRAYYERAKTEAKGV